MVFKVILIVIIGYVGLLIFFNVSSWIMDLVQAYKRRRLRKRIDNFKVYIKKNKPGNNLDEDSR